MVKSDTTQTSRVQSINQEFKEKEVEKRAEKMGLPYINLLQFKVNPDVLALFNEEESKNANMVAFFQIGKKLRVALSDANNIHAQSLVQRLKNEHFAVNINLASEESIRVVQEIYKSPLMKKEEKKDIEVTEKKVIASEVLKDFEVKQEEKKLTASAVTMDELHALAVQMNASDIHFQVNEDTLVSVRFRIDGILQEISKTNEKNYQTLLNQIKFQARLKLNVTKLPQDGQYFFTINKRNIDVRVSVIPSVFGESVVLRLLDPQKGITSLSDLGFKKYALEKIAMILTKNEGMILMVGPTGSGKTTTLYSLLDVLNRPQRKIITLEDPVEYRMKGIVQCEVHREKEDGFSFEEGLISVLRQDPDVIMLGEIREPKVANIAVQAAMTGHLVLSTLHTNTAIETVSRLKNLGVAEYLLSPALNAIIAQRLLRRICPHCTAKRARKKSELDVIKSFVSSVSKKGIDLSKMSLDEEVYGAGCDYCNKTGYLGRITVSEIFMCSPAIKELIQNNASEKEVLTQALAENMVTMREDALFKVIEGQTSFEEVFRVVS